MITGETLKAMGWAVACEDIPGTNVGPTYHKGGLFATFYDNTVQFTASIRGTLILLQVTASFNDLSDSNFQKFEGQMLVAKMGAEMMLGGAQ